jgi:hypothetical protein
MTTKVILFLSSSSSCDLVDREPGGLSPEVLLLGVGYIGNRLAHGHPELVYELVEGHVAHGGYVPDAGDPGHPSPEEGVLQFLERGSRGEEDLFELRVGLEEIVDLRGWGYI